jgi:hypothetical protein
VEVEALEPRVPATEWWRLRYITRLGTTPHARTRPPAGRT